MTAEVLENALEKVESHLHPEGSFDVDAHEVPTGREEIWRFTPLKRLRDVHKDAALDGSSFKVEADLADGVTAQSVAAADSRRGTSASSRSTGSPRAPGRPRPRSTRSTSPRTPSSRVPRRSG